MSWWLVQWDERLCERGGWLWAVAASMNFLLVLSRHATPPTCSDAAILPNPLAPQVKDSVAAAVILKSFFEDPGAALLVKTGRTRRQPGSRPPPRQQEQQQQQQEQQREQEGQEQGPQQGQQHQEQEQQQAL